MTEQKREKPLGLDMPFNEALERFVNADPDELPENVKLRRSKKKGGGKKPPPKGVKDKGKDA